MHSNAAKCRPLLPHDARGWGGPILAADIIPQHQAVAVALPNCEQPAQTPPPDSPQRNDHQPKRAVFPPAAARETCEGVASLEQGSSSTAQQIARMSESGPPAARAGSHCRRLSAVRPSSRHHMTIIREQPANLCAAVGLHGSVIGTTDDAGSALTSAPDWPSPLALRFCGAVETGGGPQKRNHLP